jgi:hypothetical protein
MAINPEIEGIVALRPEPNGAADEVAVIIEPAPPSSQLESPVVLRPSEKPVRAHRRRGWLLPVAIGAAGLIASGPLGGFLWSTIGQRDTARHELATTQTTLTTTRGQLTAAHSEAATRKVTSDYVTFAAVESGRAMADYGTMVACNSYGECRTAAQQTLSDLQAFQIQRAAATMAPALSNADGQLRDGLSAAIAALQELITGADNNDLSKVKDGGHKLDAAFLAIGKAEAALGTGSS